MKFSEALKAMKEGKKVKLPSWGGYWCWNQEKKTIEMYCREKDSDTGKDVLDIRETQRIEYTLENICSEEWIIADEENTPILGGVATFSFGEAIKYIKRGLRVARKGWNGKGMWICLAGGLPEVEPGEFLIKEVDIVGVPTWIGMKTADNLFVPWTASQTDMLAEDWVFVD